MLKIIIVADAVEQTDRLEKYVRTRVGRLEKYIPRAARASAHVEVRLRQTKTKAGKQARCELTIHLPQETIHVTETTEHLYATIDVAIVRARQSIADYKSKHLGSTLRHRLRHKLGRGKRPEA